ncbi:MAG: fructokinase [Mycobacteriales bacterium]
MIAVLGEAVVDLVEQEQQVYRAHPGGSPLNVAVGLGRLGRPTVLHARLGADAFGPMFRRHLAASGVDASGLVAAAEPSTLAVATIGPDGAATYDFWTAGTADWQWTAAELAGVPGPGAIALHTGSMALEVEPGASAIRTLLRRERDRGAVTICYDPNVRLARRGPVEAGGAEVRATVALSDLVKVSADDLAWLHPDRDPQEVALRWVGGGGPALVVVTLGAAGAVAVTTGGVHRQVPAPPVDVVDTVGAGDAFMSGLLDALAATGALGAGSRRALAGLTPADLDDLLAHACLVAAVTCTRAGADPPTRADLDAAARSA